MDNRRRIATTIPLAIPVAISLPFQWPIILPELGGGACPFPTTGPDEEEALEASITSATEVESAIFLAGYIALRVLIGVVESFWPDSSRAV